METLTPPVFKDEEEALGYLQSMIAADPTGAGSPTLVTRELMEEAEKLVGTPVPTAFPQEEKS